LVTPKALKAILIIVWRNEPLQLKLFTIPLCDAETGEDELNRFLRGRRVLEIVHHFVDEGANSRWCFLVKNREAGNRQDRIDYRDVLDAASFARFCSLRKARKAVAEKEGVPAFAIFTDKQMAELARFETITVDTMCKVEGIGTAKTEKFGLSILQLLEAETAKKSEGEGNETGRQPV
jgi:superfamily II DNA helicase RecQ